MRNSFSTSGCYGFVQGGAKQANFYEVIEMACLQGSILPIVGETQEFPGMLLKRFLQPQEPNGIKAQDCGGSAPAAAC